MQQITSPSVDSLPKMGYLVNNEEKKEKYYKNESHIPKQDMFIGAKAEAHKLYNDIFTYFPKGFAGSKNSDFYEYLSLGKVPNLIGSGMLIGLYTAANYFFNACDKEAAFKEGKKAAAGVILYAAGKWAYQKLSRTLINGSTAIPLDMRYVKKVDELPEPGQEKGLVRKQYPGVFDSVNFYRLDLLVKDGELNHNNAYHYDDKIVKKAGFKDKMNATNQTSGKKIREVKSRTTALENIGKYIVAATGVALGFQKSFEKVSLKQPSTILTALKDGAKQLWDGAGRNIFTKHSGKALIIASGVATLLTWLIPTLGFKHNSNTMKNTVDTNKEHEVC